MSVMCLVCVLFHHFMKCFFALVFFLLLECSCNVYAWVVVDVLMV